jgi:hypothetical protein
MANTYPVWTIFISFGQILKKMPILIFSIRLNKLAISQQLARPDNIFPIRVNIEVAARIGKNYN